MTSPLSNLADNYAEGIQRTKYKYGEKDKKCEACKTKYRDCECFLACRNFTDNF